MLIPSRKTIWTGTQVSWGKVVVDEMYEAAFAVIQHRQQRLPLYEEKYLLAVVVNHTLMLLKSTQAQVTLSVRLTLCSL